MKQKHLPGVGFLVVVVGLNAAGNTILYSQCIVLESILVLYNPLKSKFCWDEKTMYLYRWIHYLSQAHQGILRLLYMEKDRNLKKEVTMFNFAKISWTPKFLTSNVIFML